MSEIRPNHRRHKRFVMYLLSEIMVPTESAIPALSLRPVPSGSGPQQSGPVIVWQTLSRIDLGIGFLLRCSYAGNKQAIFPIPSG
jgi:hypothetical protein